MIMGYVYLLLSVSPDNIETHKIGITTRKTSVRVKEHQTGNPNKISILREYETKNYFNTKT